MLKEVVHVFVLKGKSSEILGKFSGIWSNAALIGAFLPRAGQVLSLTTAPCLIVWSQVNRPIHSEPAELGCLRKKKLKIASQ